MADKFYITSSLPYVNARPHLGHALEFIQADAIARWQRILGKEVFFLSGSDEHGAKIMRSAESAGKDVRKFADENSFLVRQLIKTLGISIDDFIRTSDQKRHFPGAQEMWKKLAVSGDIYKKKYKGLYCVGHEAFVTQKDLVGGVCADHGQTPEIIEEENYFFRLSKYAGAIREAIDSGELEIHPEARKNEMLSFLDEGEGLQDVSFSRPAKDIPWGIPVPGDAEHTMYVWSDALSNYVTALGFGSKNQSLFKKFWPADLHVVGKDILRFHAVIWTGMLLSIRLPLPKALFVHGFVTSGGVKMSKTLGNVVDPFDIAERYGSDALRYYLLSEIPDFEDGDFTEERFREVYNSRLANGLGNFISRVAAMIKNYFPNGLDKPQAKLLAAAPVEKQSAFLEAKNKAKIGEAPDIQYFIDLACRNAQESMAKYELKSAIDRVWLVLRGFDSYIQTYEPFKLVKTDMEKTKAVLWNLAYGALSAAWLLQPFLPKTSAQIFKIFGIDSSSKKEWLSVKIKPHKPLFPRKD